jgi:hypothetical protein
LASAICRPARPTRGTAPGGEKLGGEFTDSEKREVAKAPHIAAAKHRITLKVTGWSIAA